jgi:hypothetical protein
VDRPEGSWHRLVDAQDAKSALLELADGGVQAPVPELARGLEAIQ